VDPLFRRHRQPTPFPNRTPDNTRTTSPEDRSYNCFGWAIGKLVVMSWTPGCFWPEGAPRDFRIESLVQAYELLGFERCSDGAFEEDWEKIAIYAEAGFASHAALQTSNAKWTSKLGLDGEDVEHDDLNSIAGGVYGNVVQFLKRPRKSE
jgi:hypothetical protein